MSRSLRLLAHWPGLPGYAAACVAALRERHAVETLVLHHRPTGEHAPFDRARFPDVGPVDDVTGEPGGALRARARAFAPDVALVSGWRPEALHLAWAARRAGARVVAMVDTVRRPGRRRQRLLGLARRLVFDRLFDRYLVPGQRSRALLEAAGVPSARVWTGLYASTSGRAVERADRWPQSFLFLGQYVERKGLPELLDAFARTGAGWSLRLCGDGPLKPLVASAAARDDRIEDLGFVQPGALGDVLRRAGAFVLPSREDMWPLALLEAAASGLPVVCTDACGSADELVRHGESGLVVPTGDVPALAAALGRIAGQTDDALRAMGARGRALAAPYTPARWADGLMAHLDSLTGSP